ncbi:glycosyltransferase [Rhodococcus sp. ABRD24]|uniref:glycosyltransferase n=1 Tax=Rhodococcus sp. ABRD24 TaxID=2507582 RepID=UPI00103F0F1E|nr:glycosyltransferase [Rhodococcus sp. ABRD24]QBJ97856.1 glycosyltransferase [Rhodococcus sp. ABRD24]
MAPQLVSVIIPAYNAVDLIDEQLEALATQDYPGEFEVVISDNGSTDGLREHLARHPVADRLNLRCVDSSDRQGSTHARNVGVSESTGEFLAFCEHDDRVHPGWLSAMVRAAAEFDAVGGSVETASINTPKVASWRIMPAPDEQFGATDFLPYAIGCNFGAWRSSLEKIGGFDESFNRGGEDIAVSWQLQLAGLTLGHAPDAVVAYRFRDTYKGTWKQMSAYGRNSVQVYLTFREHGQKRGSLKSLGLSLLGVVLLNPLVPRFIARVPRGLWVAQTAFLTGKLRASWRNRVLYV